VIDVISEEKVATIRRWKHFDAGWYLKEYPDVGWVGLDPAYHYLWIGAQIGRKPSANFACFTDKYYGIDDLIQRIDVGDFSDRPDAGNLRAQPAEFVGPGGIDVAAVQGFSVAVHAHIYYADLAGDFAQYLSRIPCSFDLYVSTADAAARESVARIFASIPNAARVDVRVVPNIGRDIASFVVEFGKDLAKYDVISHIQTKKSLYNNGNTDGWREYLLNSLFEQPDRIALLLRALKSGRYGIIYPQCFHNLPYVANTWLANSGLAQTWAPRFGVEKLPDGYFDFPAGSMFWACTEAIRPLLEAGLEWSDFPPEQGQTDGTLAHCIERMLGVVPTSRHFQLGVIRDTRTPSWSRWRLNQFTDWPLDHRHSMIADNDVKVVAFDIFDTLLTRPFLDADYVKCLLDAEYAELGLNGFRELRMRAEVRAREIKGGDVDIYEIYRQLALEQTGKRASLTPDREISLESMSVRPRRDVVDLLQFAVQKGKKVILASDMFLTRAVVEDMLKRCGISGWDKLYLSSEIGLRKDSGKLYEFILGEEKIAPQQMVMIGDNERSDIQIPSDMGIKVGHVVKPVNLMRAMPRLADLVPDADKAPVADQFLFGAIASANFGPICYPDFSHEDMFGSTARAIGYSLLGPITVAFSQWLFDQAQDNGLERLYFLAREGKFLKQVFDYWQTGRENSVRSEYLLVSRRAVTVPCIRTIEDIFDIAAANDFYPESMALFLNERFGTVLSDQQWTECEHAKVWSRDSLLTVMGHNIDHIRPFLRFIMAHILKQASLEREAALDYFHARNLCVDGKGAVVDVGYGATIQRHLIKLLDQKVHGLYMMTDSRGQSLGASTDVLAAGCFAEGVERVPSAPQMFLNSFLLEKMLSADDEQVIRYTSSGSVEFRGRGDYIDQGQKHRQEMQQGAMDFVKDAVRFREEMWAPLRISKVRCDELFSRFVTGLSDSEKQIFASVPLDDFYCGRGVVVE
jgi:predicted HAD superfamily hydrolase